MRVCVQASMSNSIKHRQAYLSLSLFRSLCCTAKCWKKEKKFVFSFSLSRFKNCRWLVYALCAVVQRAFSEANFERVFICIWILCNTHTRKQNKKNGHVVCNCCLSSFFFVLWWLVSVDVLKRERKRKNVHHKNNCLVFCIVVVVVVDQAGCITSFFLEIQFF